MHGVGGWGWWRVSAIGLRVVLCDKYLQLLFTVLEKSPEPTIRANTIIAAGDLTFRYPNLIEPWTPYLYAR